MSRISRLLMNRFSAALVVLLTLTAASCEGPPPPVGETLPAPTVALRSEGDFNLRSRVAMHGYDPVSYWPEGGGVPQMGSEQRAVALGGVIYLFASDQNLAAFRTDPARYEPAHGGWCSYAMRDGSKVDVDPKTFLLRDGRLFLFYNSGGTNTLKLWQEGAHEPQLQQADVAWQTAQR